MYPGPPPRVTTSFSSIIISPGWLFSALTSSALSMCEIARLDQGQCFVPFRGCQLCRCGVERVPWHPGPHLIFPVVSFLCLPSYFKFSLTLFILANSTSALLPTHHCTLLPPTSPTIILVTLTSDLQVVEFSAHLSVLNLSKAFSFWEPSSPDYPSGCCSPSP